MVSSRGRYKASKPLLVAELRNEVDAAANLERARGLMVLVFDPDLDPYNSIERGIVM
jgi:hypothetical protein